MVPVLLALGANVGEPIANLSRAVGLLRQQMDVQRVSRVVESAPMYNTDQPLFYNAALSARTGLSPLALLGLLKEIESQIGRVQRERNGPREIDLDIIAYGRLIYRFAQNGIVHLEIPHPKAMDRRFVLQPMADVAPDFSIPTQGVVRDLLRCVGQEGEVRFSSQQID